MGSLIKHRARSVSFQLKHNAREYDKGRKPKNIEIDPERTKQNYYLSPEDRGRTAKENKAYYKKRMQELYHIKRSDLTCGVEWCITAPKDLAREHLKEFFDSTYKFLNTKYGEENCIQAIVHFDEGVKNSVGEVIQGSPHMHYMFIPTVKISNKNPAFAQSKYDYKVCAKEVINKKHLKQFHEDYQKWINESGLKATVHSGVTGGKNRSVAALKLETKEKELAAAREQIKELEGKIKVLEKSHENAWGESKWESANVWGRNTTEERTW